MKLLGALVLLSLLIHLPGCGKEECLADCTADDLPDITTEGKNTFGCLVNGVAWKASGGGIGTDNPGGSISFEDQSISISGRDRTENTRVSLIVLDFRDIFNRPAFLFEERAVRDEVCGWIAIDSSTFNFEILRLDTQDLIFAGTFEFLTLNQSCDTVHHVTDGRFDLMIRN